MNTECKYFLGPIKIKKKSGCKCNKTFKEEEIDGAKCSLFGKVKEKICNGCKRFKK